MNTQKHNSFILHYFFNDGTHYMDAYARNYCEKELLAIISTISTDLKVRTKVEVEAKEPGGIVELYNFIVSNQGVALVEWADLIAVIIQIFMSRKTKKDKLEQDLHIEYLQLYIDKAKEESKNNNLNIPISEEDIKSLLDENIKLKKQKSNFYYKLQLNPKVKKIETSIITNDNNTSIAPMTVDRNDFDNYIIETDDIDPLVDKNAKIEVISPVLIKGKYNWRGMYVANHQNIEFSMQDKDFKNDIINKAIPFQTGTFIDCELIIERKIDEEGNLYNSHYKVTNVNHISIGTSIIETPKYTLRRRKNEADASQLSFLDDPNLQ